jgi:hypothetical protein
MADEVHGRRSGEIEITLADGVPDVNALPAHGGRIRLAEGSAQYRRAKLLGIENGFGHTAIIRLGKESVKVKTM